jgi:hypothetical protein
MDKTTKLLGGLLAAQLVFAIWAFSAGTDLSVHRPDEPLLAFNSAEVTGIKVEGPDETGVSLSRVGDGWILTDTWNVPAKASKVTQLLDRLQNLKTGLAVATTGGAKERFAVADTQFERRITLVKGDEPLATLYLGTSPGLRKVHARRSDDDLVYSISFATYEASAKADDWLDAGILQFKEPELEAIELEDLTLTKSRSNESEQAEGDSDKGWTASGLEAGARLDQTKAVDLVRKLAQLDVRKVLGTEVKPDYQQDTPALLLNLRRSEVEPVTWTLSKPEQGDDYVLKSSQHPWYFGVASWIAEPLLELAKRDALIISPQPSAKERADENGRQDEAETEVVRKTPEEPDSQSKPVE